MECSLLAYDVLKYDEKSKEIIKALDEEETDAGIIEAIKKAAQRLDDVNPLVAKTIRKKMGFTDPGEKKISKDVNCTG